MRKSLGNKRNELSEDHIKEITRLYAEFKHDTKSRVIIDGKSIDQICSKIFKNQEFGFLKITVERPLKLNFQASEERIEKLKLENAFVKLAESKKRKNEKVIGEEIEQGKKLQSDILQMFANFDSSKIYKNRDEFTKDLNSAIKKSSLSLTPQIKKSILNALSTQDETADICLNSKGNPEPDSNLRDTELVPLPNDISLPLPIEYDTKADNSNLVNLVKEACENYLEKEVKPHVKDAWIDYSKTKVGYEIPHRKIFSLFESINDLKEIQDKITSLQDEVIDLFKEVIV